MRKKIFNLSFLFFLLVFVNGEAIAIPYEYSITGTASYITAGGDAVFRNQSIMGSFVLSDPVETGPYDFDIAHYDWNLTHFDIFGQSFALSGTGVIKVTYYGIYSGIGGPEQNMSLNLGGYTAYESGTNFPFWEVSPHFYNEDGSSSYFPAFPYRMAFSGSLYSGPAATGDRYRLDVVASRGASVPEPSTMLLYISGLIGLVVFKGRKRRRC